jgi:hypothetical protein
MARDAATQVVVMMRIHTAPAHVKGGEGLNLQSASFTTYMVVEASCRQVFVISRTTGCCTVELHWSQLS